MPDAGDGTLDPALLRRIAETALEEDGWRDDVTTRALVLPAQRGVGLITAKAEGVIAGLPVAAAVFAVIDPELRFSADAPEGAAVSPGDLLARVEGALAPILTGERVALNLLQRLSGIATATRKLVEAVAGLDVTILDTRKTTPGLRELERYAVRAGGGTNHRFNLSDGVLIKDNHLAAARDRELSIGQVIEEARRNAPNEMPIEIEVTNAEEAREALDGGADMILLDNMPPVELRAVVELVGGKALTEASGGVTLENVRAVAETGVDRISVGALTHSSPALDISLEIEARG
ncbi:MAG: carboxylating nicotinate-nucleotide diphosphorylase [Chloroflexi bacterium]|nr:carboxylating nicotinate-nucleotide diphosphorylase [Chloroflexota bacterium]